GSDCLVEGFYFTGAVNAGDGIYAEWNSPNIWADNLTIRHCLFDDEIDTAIQLEFVWYANIHDCSFEECDEYGIYVDTGGSGIAYAKIYDNKFMDCSTAAMSLLGGSSNNQIYQNSFWEGGAQVPVASVNVYLNTTGGGSNMVFDNWFACTLAGGNGDWADTCSSAATDAWINNHLVDGDNVLNP
ncbi:unnamed protein product, partial [marine sediment metagenome]